MLTSLILIVGAVMMLLLVLLTVVVIGIRQEPSAEELTSQPPNLITALVRRLLGVYVRRPAGPLIPNQDHSEPCLIFRDRHVGPEGPSNERSATGKLRSSRSRSKAAGAGSVRDSSHPLHRPRAQGGESHCGHTRSSR